MMNRKPPLYRVLLLALALLGGCGTSLLPKAPSAPARHTLDDGAQAVAGPTPSAIAPTLIVSLPTAAAGFDTAHIIYLRQTQQLEHFAFNDWADTPANMLAPLIARRIEGTGAFRAVLTAPTGATGRYRLDTELVRLQQDFTRQPSQVRLTLRAVLIDASTRGVIARREFDASLATAADDPYAGVRTARLLTQQVLGELAAFCVASVPLTPTGLAP
jgi:cholesterol transport system auxiliary component